MQHGLRLAGRKSNGLLVMTELLFRVRDVPHDDLAKHVTRLHRGDIVDSRVTGHGWSERELTMPFWRILRADITLTEAIFLAASEPDPFNSKTRLWTRVRKLDLDNPLLPDRFKDWLKDDTRAVPILVVAASIPRTFFIEKGDADDFTRV